jgi:hypothetical protein
MVRRDAAPDVPGGQREAECTGGAEWTEAGHGRMLVVVPVVVLAARAVLVSVPVVVLVPVVVPVTVTALVTVAVALAMAVAVLLVTGRRPFGGLRLVAVVVTVSVSVSVSMTMTMVGPRGLRRRGGRRRVRCGRGGRGRGRAGGSRAHRPPRGGRARSNRHRSRHRCDDDRGRDEAWDRGHRRRRSARHGPRQRSCIDHCRPHHARSQRQTRRLRLPAANDELRQLDRGQRGRGKGRQHDDDSDDFAQDIPSSCRSTLAWYRRGAAGT